jgi:hypothetical protein
MRKDALFPVLSSVSAVLWLLLIPTDSAAG